MTNSALSFHRTLTAAALCAFAALSAEAQVLPNVDIPVVPAVRDVLDETVETAGRTLRSTNLRELRKVHVRDLLRRHRRVLERGPNGEAVIRREVLSLAPSGESLEKAQAAGFTVVREEGLDQLGTRIVVLLAPERMSVRRSLRRLQELDPEGTYDYNHIYSGSGDLIAAPAGAPSAQVEPSPVPIASTHVRVGLIDGGVLQTHPVFATTIFRAYGCSGTPVPSAHGTAVASLIAQQVTDRAIHLFSADVYCDAPTGGSVTAIASALEWMAREHVPVVNVSLVGPPNRMLERVIEAMIERGHVIVAAVGNDGPNAKPLYPAAYEGVVGVTGVDKRERALLEALRGPQVDFAAAGADITAASIDRKFAAVRGTSFAAPIVAALLATDCRDIVPNTHSALIDKYSKVARDLGAPGLDPTYGFGLLNPSVVSAQARQME